MLNIIMYIYCIRSGYPHKSITEFPNVKLVDIVLRINFEYSFSYVCSFFHTCAPTVWWNERGKTEWLHEYLEKVHLQDTPNLICFRVPDMQIHFMQSISPFYFISYSADECYPWTSRITETNWGVVVDAHIMLLEEPIKT